MRIGYACWIWFVLGLASMGCQHRSEEEEVWAEVNGRPIRRAEVEKSYLQQVSTLPEPLSEQEALGSKLAILNDLIQAEILLQKSAQAGALASDSDVEARLQELRANVTEEEFAAQLAARGTSLDDLRIGIRRELSVRKLLDRQLGESVLVTEREIQDYYNQYKSRFRTVEARFHVATIRVSPRAEPEVTNLRNSDARSEAEAQHKVRQLLERLRAGGDFSELARHYSEDPTTALSGGDLGFFPESALADTHPALRSAVQQLAVGATAGPVRTPEAYYIIKLLDRQPAGQQELSDPKVQESIRQLLRRQKQQLLEAAYLERARNQARVANYLARQILESHGVR